VLLTCKVCSTQFERPGSRGPVPQFCSLRCKGKRDYARPGRREYERDYRRGRRARGLDLTDNAARRDYFRERWRRLYGDPHPGLEIPTPYTGHRWLDMAREAVNGGRDVDPDYRDFGYDDEVGEALLALLEGRDPQQAVKAFRAKEFIPRHMTVFTSEWHDSDDLSYQEDKHMPKAPSAEEEVMAGFAVITRYHHGQNDRPKNNSMKSRTQPSRKRRQNGRSWMKHAA